MVNIKKYKNVKRTESYNRVLESRKICNLPIFLVILESFVGQINKRCPVSLK